MRAICSLRSCSCFFASSCSCFCFSFFASSSRCFFSCASQRCSSCFFFCASSLRFSSSRSRSRFASSCLRFLSRSMLMSGAFSTTGGGGVTTGGACTTCCCTGGGGGGGGGAASCGMADQSSASTAAGVVSLSQLMPHVSATISRMCATAASRKPRTAAGSGGGAKARLSAVACMARLLRDLHRKADALHARALQLVHHVDHEL